MFDCIQEYSHINDVDCIVITCFHIIKQMREDKRLRIEIDVNCTIKCIESTIYYIKFSL